jgi:GT2 family glycosyltransferase
LEKNLKEFPSVAIVTPVFNGIGHTRRFLTTLRKQDYPNFKIIITDDGSTDGTAEILTKEFPEVILLLGDGNLWWSGGTNKGVKYAQEKKFDYVLTINNDVEVEERYISSLVEAAECNAKSLIGSLVCFIDNPKKVWYAGGRYDTKTGEMRHVIGLRDEFIGLQPSDWLTGMGVLVPIKAYISAGLYDEAHFPQYFGDAEFSARAASKGFTLLVNSQSVVLADVSSSWVQKQLSQPKLRFIYDLFFSIRSPYHLPTRIYFYRNYWPSLYPLALFRLYTITLLGLYWSIVAVLIKRCFRIKSFRDLIPKVFK